MIVLVRDVPQGPSVAKVAKIRYPAHHCGGPIVPAASVGGEFGRKWSGRYVCCGCLFLVKVNDIQRAKADRAAKADAA